METIFELKAYTNRGEILDFSQFEGKPLLIINTASKCGLTPQFEGLEKLWKQYKDKGLIVIGFPSGDFANQELKDGNEAEEFCRINYGVSFQIMQKVRVNGIEADPVFKFLKKKTRGIFGSRIKWNFTKFLVAPDGKSIKRYAPFISPSKIDRDIKKLLNL
ncbi:MAG: glutathione peroxidase [Porphyromonas sp.]|nr:glutathione peroxidase [Porphyromonas sp.]